MVERGLLLAAAHREQGVDEHGEGGNLHASRRGAWRAADEHQRLVDEAGDGTERLGGDDAEAAGARGDGLVERHPPALGAVVGGERAVPLRDEEEGEGEHEQVGGEAQDDAGVERKLAARGTAPAAEEAGAEVVEHEEPDAAEDRLRREDEDYPGVAGEDGDGAGVDAEAGVAEAHRGVEDAAVDVADAQVEERRADSLDGEH